MTFTIEDIWEKLLEADEGITIQLDDPSQADRIKRKLSKFKYDKFLTETWLMDIYGYFALSYTLEGHILTINKVQDTQTKAVYKGAIINGN